MSNIPPFHTQLASIMEVLANAAVAEICELVDNGYAVLHLEISRSQKENRALKRKLHMMELRIAGGAEDKKSRTSSVNICSERVQICDELRQTTSRESEEEYLPTAERTAGSRMGISVWGDGEPTALEDTTFASTTKDRSADKEKRNLESLLIKKEKLEEDVENSDPPRGLDFSDERAIESDGGERAPIVDAQPAPATDAEELAEQHGTRRSVWEDGGLDAVLKAETEIETVNLQATAGRLNSLGNEYALYERPGQLDTFFTQRAADTETEGPACSYSTKANPEALSAHSEPQLAPTADQGLERHMSALDALNMKPEGVMIDMIDSVSNKVGVVPSSSWSKEAISGAVLKCHMYYKDDGNRGALQHEDPMAVCSSHTQLSMRENTEHSEAPSMIGYAPGEEGLAASRSAAANHRARAREKRFLCTFCWKSFTCPKNLETHQRVHTGEKPFGCAQCGKRFSQSAHLKKHHSVHTGEKPFRCAKCGKCFSDSSNLKRHQYVHTGERPFRCTQCGKRFSFLGNLKRHQSVHLGKKPVGRTPWEEFTLFKSP